MESLEAERDQYAQFVKHKQKLRRRAKWKRARFIICMLALPVGHFIVFFFYVNFNSVLMCFQNFNFAKNAVEWVGWENFTRLYNEIRFLDDGRFITAIKKLVSILFCFTVCIASVGRSVCILFLQTDAGIPRFPNDFLYSGFDSGHCVAAPLRFHAGQFVRRTG